MMTGTGITTVRATTVLTGLAQGRQDTLQMTYPWDGRAQSKGSLMDLTVVSVVVLIPVIVMHHLLEMTALVFYEVTRYDCPVSYDKIPRDYGDSSRSSGTAERSRYPESYSGRPNPVVLRDFHTQNQGPGRSSTLSTLSTSCRPMSSIPRAFCPSRGGGPISISGEVLRVEQHPDLRLD